MSQTAFKVSTLTSLAMVVILGAKFGVRNMSALQRVALVTGASSGIGQATALRLAQDGFHVLVHYNRNAAGAEKTFSQIQQIRGSAEVLQFDVTDSKAVDLNIEKYFFKTSNRLPYALINNAGLHKDTLTGLMSDSDFNEVLNTNVSGAFYLMRACVKRFIRERQGTIVNVSSLAGQTGNPGQINYAASKAALIAMTKTLAMEVASRGIRVNAVAPGLIETEMIQSIPGLEDFKNRIPLKRFGKADEVAGAISFLCSNDASYITGHTLSVNGGLFPT